MKENTRDKLLTLARDMVGAQGFNNTGIGQILKEAGVPKGSFYHYFPSKDDLGYALIDAYGLGLKQHLSHFLSTFEGSALSALRSYFEHLAALFAQDFSHCNCLLGNLGQELAVQHEGFRLAVRTHFIALERLIADQFDQAKQEGDINLAIDCEKLAQMLFSSWEGALLRAKLEKSSDNLDYFIKHFFEGIPR